MLVLAGCGGEETTSPFPGSYLYALSPAQQSVSRYSLPSAALIPDLFATGAQPVDLAVRLGKGYVLDAAERSLRVFATSDGTALANAPLGDTASPVRVFPYADTVAYVTDSATGSLLVVDPKAGALTRTIALGGTPAAMAVALSKVYVTNTHYDPVTDTYGTGTVSIVGIGSNTVLKTINVGPVPLALVADDKGWVHVLAAGPGDAQSHVYRINARYDVVVGSPIPLGGHANDLVLGQDVLVYAPASASLSLGTPAGVIVYDWETGSLIRAGDNPVPVGPNPVSAVALRDKIVAIADGGALGDVYVIDESLSSAPLAAFSREITRLAAE